MVLKIDEDFDAEHVEKLLENDFYLFYDVEIWLESAKAYKAINQFLGNVEGRLSSKFFRRVKAVVAMDWIDLYNDFIKQCVERQLKLSKIETQIKCPIIENMKLEEESKKVLAENSEEELAEESKTKLEYFSCYLLLQVKQYWW